jgi:hypothetical protein
LQCLRRPRPYLVEGPLPLNASVLTEFHYDDPVQVHNLSELR